MLIPWKAWKKGSHAMGQVRPYEAQPTEIPDTFSLADFSFKLVLVEMINPKAKDFSSKYKLNLPTSVRGRF